MKEIVVYQSDPAKKSGFQKALDDCLSWSSQHQAELGVAEMALGAGIIYWGVQSGAIQIGSDLVGSKLPDIVGAVSGATGGVAAPLIAGTFLKSIFIGGVSGIAGITMVPAIPVIALIGGGAAVFGAFGYTATDVMQRFFEPSFVDYVEGASIVSIGIALMVDGARRIVKDERVSNAASNFKDGILQLSSDTTEIVAKSWDDLQTIIAELAKSPEAIKVSAGMAAGGAVAGSAVAAGTVTVLGSHGLGAVALSLGLVSAPVWPIIAGGAAGLAIGVAAWKGVKHFTNKQEDSPDEPPLLGLSE